MCPRCLVALEKREVAAGEPAAATPDTTMPQVRMPEARTPRATTVEVAAAPPTEAPAKEPTPVPLRAAPRERAERREPPRPSGAQPAPPTVHPHEEYSDLSTIGWAILAAFLTILAARGTIGLLLGEPHLFALIWTAGLWLLVVLTTRMWLYRYHLRAVQFHFPSSIGLGSEVAYRLVLTPARRLPVDCATLLLRAEERVRSFSNNAEKTLRVERFRTIVEICRDIILAGNQEAVFAGTFTLPEHVPPSFAGEHNSVLWTARVWVGMPGWRPDVRKRLDLTVLAVVPPKPEEPAAPESSEIPLPALEACGARLTLNAPLDAEGRVRVRAGESVEGRLLLRPREQVGCRRILLEVGYAVASRGHDERRTIQTETLWEGELEADREIEVPVNLDLPAAGPVSYYGQNFDIHWSARIRVDIPMWTDLVATIPVVVEPAARAATSP